MHLLKTASSLLGLFNSQMHHWGTGSVFPQKPEIPLIYGFPRPWNWDTDMLCSRHWKAQHCSLFYFFSLFSLSFFFSFSPKESVSCRITFLITSGSNPWWLPTYPNWLSCFKPRQGVWTDKQKKKVLICWDMEKTFTSRKYQPVFSLSQLLAFLL